MPGAASLWIDTWAPAQYAFGGTGGSGPVNQDSSVNSTASTQNYDPTLTWKIAGTIVLALATVFILQSLGFRFVVAAGVGR